jgi:hypothetical protein
MRFDRHHVPSRPPLPITVASNATTAAPGPRPCFGLTCPLRAACLHYDEVEGEDGGEPRRLTCGPGGTDFTSKGAAQ